MPTDNAPGARSQQRHIGASCGAYNTLARAGMSFWRAMEEYHRVIQGDDDMRHVAQARKHLKRARRRLWRATQWGVNYDQPAMPAGGKMTVEQTQAAHAADDAANLRRELERVTLERDQYLEALRWYASPDQWITYTDDRGRDNFTFRYGDDGGTVARAILKKWGPNAPA